MRLTLIDGALKSEQAIAHSAEGLLHKQGMLTSLHVYLVIVDCLRRFPPKPVFTQHREHSPNIPFRQTMSTRTISEVYRSRGMRGTSKLALQDHSDE
jgi:hypothetical protein